MPAAFFKSTKSKCATAGLFGGLGNTLICYTQTKNLDESKLSCTQLSCKSLRTVLIVLLMPACSFEKWLDLRWPWRSRSQDCLTIWNTSNTDYSIQVWIKHLFEMQVGSNLIFFSCFPCRLCRQCQWWRSSSAVFLPNKQKKGGETDKLHKLITTSNYRSNKLKII